MTTCLGKSCSFGLLCVPFVNCCQFLYLVISLLFWGQDMGSDCVSSWSLLIFLLHMNGLISHKVFVVLHPLQYYNCLVTYSRMMGKSKSSKIVLRVEIFPHFQEYFHHIKTIIWICFFVFFFFFFLRFSYPVNNIAGMSRHCLWICVTFIRLEIMPNSSYCSSATKAIRQTTYTPVPLY